MLGPPQLVSAAASASTSLGRSASFSAAVHVCPPRSLGDGGTRLQEIRTAERAAGELLTHLGDQTRAVAADQARLAQLGSDAAESPGMHRLMETAGTDISGVQASQTHLKVAASVYTCLDEKENVSKVLISLSR